MSTATQQPTSILPAIFDKMMLCNPTIVLPVVGRGQGYPVALHAGSVVRHWFPGEPDDKYPTLLPQLDWKYEQLISYADSDGTLRFGHVRNTTIMRRPVLQTVDYASIEWSGSDGSRLNVVDLLRERIALAKRPTVAYVMRYKSRSHLALYHAVIREFGGRDVEGDDHPAIAERLLRLILPSETYMKTVDEADEAVEETPKRKGKKKGKAKGAAKKAAPKEGSERIPMGVSLSKKLLPLLREAGVKGAAIVTVKSLGDGETVKKAALIALRDAVNEAAGSVREDNGKLASQLSSANRTVRRLSRGG